jgi:UDP-N-acetylmuramoyl-tripeptide--D-alanyl-D-alanine ligase
MEYISTLLEWHAKCTDVAIDSRKVQSGTMFFALKGEHVDGNDFATNALEQGALIAVVDDERLKDVPGCFWVDDVLTTLQQLGTAYRDTLGIPILALTGSNGKTTTKELIYAVLQTQFRTFATKGNLNNHIGVPLSLLSIPKDAEIAIIEMGANHQGEIAFLSELVKPVLGLITNIGKAHLEGFGGLEGVKKGKSELYHYLMEHSGRLFVNTANVALQDVYAGYDKVELFGEGEGDYLHGTAVLDSGFAAVQCDGILYRSRLVGAYNAGNILAAIAVGKYFGIEKNNIQSGIAAYEPDNNRSQWLEYGNNYYIMDAYNANPSSMSAALKHFQTMGREPGIVILGDMLELGDAAIAEHKEIIKLACAIGCSEVITVGPLFREADTEQATRNFENTLSLRSWLQQQAFENTYFLVKGSRRIGLERILGEGNVV